MTLSELIVALVTHRPPKGTHRRLPTYYRVGGALLARGKWVNTKDRIICPGTNCKCHKHFKHAKGEKVTA